MDLYWCVVRIFHVILGSLLAYLGIQTYRDIEYSKVLMYLLGTLGAGAVVYHGLKIPKACFAKKDETIPE